MSAGRARQALLTLLSDGFLVLTTVVALLLGFLWFMSPLGLGFAEQSADPVRRQWAETVYWLSYFLGIPMLLIGQVVAIICRKRGRKRWSLLIPVLTIGSFALCATLALGLRH